MAEITSLLLATRNAHKTREVQAILGNRFVVTDLRAQAGITAVEETGSTFEENAALKAEGAARQFGGLVLADDSGLEVDALGGEPGVRSARYAGEQADDEMNRQRLIAELARVGARGKERSARFRCVLALAEPGKEVLFFRGAVEGIIVNQARGKGGFGYDPLFVPQGHCETYAELPPEVKNAGSHRARALAALQEHFNALR